MAEYITEEIKDGTITYRHDVCELIRCKECKFQKTLKYTTNDKDYVLNYCGLLKEHYPLGENDDYCSKAERAEDGTKGHTD